MLLHDLGAIRQTAYVVRDLHKAMAYWTNTLGVGPFFLFEEAPIQELCYRGKPTPAKLAGAFANTGGMQIELAQPLDDHPSIFRDHFVSNTEGQHHVAFWTRDLDMWVDRCAKAGIDVLQSGYTGAADGRFVYMNSGGHPGTIVEISEVQGRKEAFFAEVAKAAENWDGRNPVRRMDI
jgi:catechol 2,3-dioxygenase-like lactoylglutathione lyase family enzyme